MMHNETTAKLLAEKLNDVYGRLAPEYYAHLLSKKDALKKLDGGLLTAVFDELINLGLVVMPRNVGVISLTAVQDGRRSRTEHPDRLEGWQYLGQLTDHGKPPCAPNWAAENIRHNPDLDRTSFKSTRSSIPYELHIGTWVVRNRWGHHEGRPDIFLLPDASIARWYHKG